MNILVTGSRAPASMDIMRSLIKQGYQVYSVDSMRFPLGRFVKGLKKHFTVSKPNRNLQHFIDDIKAIIIDYKIDLLIPTCEEIFFISNGYDELSKYTRLLCEPFQRLNLLHNKYTFNQLVVDYGLDAPKSWLLNTQEDKKKIPKNGAIVLKPVYSRFGSHVIINPSQREINELPINVPYIAQQCVVGKEYCAYAIADKGTVLIQSCYHPKYTAGPAAGIYFEPADIKPITDFIRVFCQKFQFSGQIAFDFILEDGKAFVLESNPRITSGFHFISDDIQWPSILKGQAQECQMSTKPYMIGLGMKVHGLSHLWANPRQFISDYRKARDVMKEEAYPWLGVKSLATIANILARMMIEKKNFHQASTDDIEFNGEL
jgi:predicted ATP-grasp superfamily ATP-dependent carboligase